uniref:Protein kinase domain-containing protein n=2 Tax=Caenorhabditis japonica TaxID=281687 RepID=A0A8R1HWR6_CAEJA
MNILIELQQNGAKYSPKFISGGKEPKFFILVMELLGENLKKLHQRCSTTTPSTWSRVGIQCLYVVKEMHDFGYVHLDLKPGNFAMGPVDSGVNSRVLFVLDFGISQKFTKKRNGELEFKTTQKTAALKGTPIYASLNAHAHLELGRCDDISSLLYMMAEFVKPLPWDSIDDLDEISKLKSSQKLKDLFKNDAFDAVETMIKNCSTFSFPDYELVYTTFRGVFEKSGGQWIDPYDWESPQMPSYKRWRELAEKQKFPWENHEEMLIFLRKDPFDALLKKYKEKEALTTTITQAKDTVPTPTQSKEEKGKKKPVKKKSKKKKSEMTIETMVTCEEQMTPLHVVRKMSRRKVSAPKKKGKAAGK